MRLVVYYIIKTKKWIIINSLGVLFLLFSILLYYGSFNRKYYNDNIVIFKSNGIIGYSDKVDMSNINKLLEDPNIKNVSLYITSPNFSGQDNEYFEEIKFSVVFGNVNDTLRSGNSLLNDSTGSIIVNQEYLVKNNLRIGDSIIINKKDFTIIGVSNFRLSNSFVISYKDYLNLNLNIYGYNIRANESVNEKNINDVVKSIQLIMNDNSLNIENPNNEFSNYIDNLLFGFIYFIMGLLSTLSLYQFSIKRRKKIINILLLSGTKRKYLYLIEMIFILISFSIAFITAMILVNGVNYYIFQGIFNIDIFLLKPKNYFIVFLVLVSIYSIFSLATLNYCYTRNIVRNVKEIYL